MFLEISRLSVLLSIYIALSFEALNIPKLKIGATNGQKRPDQQIKEKSKAFSEMFAKQKTNQKNHMHLKSKTKI